MTPSQNRMLRKHMDRLERAADDKAFQGTIPAGESEAAAQAWDAIDDELEAARHALLRYVGRIAK